MNRRQKKKHTIVIRPLCDRKWFLRLTRRTLKRCIRDGFGIGDSDMVYVGNFVFLNKEKKNESKYSENEQTQNN
jgi:hypothetical protein